jgi:hypothetical protein
MNAPHTLESPMHERTIAWLETLLFLAVIVIVWLAVPL